MRSEDVDRSPRHARAEAPRLAPGPEFDLIRRFLGDAPAPRADVRVGPGDDCAVVAGDGIALSTDLSVEGVHFRRDWLSAKEIGWRAATAALSDLAAVAARPIGILVSLAAPSGDAGPFAEALMDGCRAAAESVGGVLLGGDLARTSGPLVVDVTVVGEARDPVLRSGSQVGDEVWVTGMLGGSGAAVASLLAGEVPDDGARARFAHPVARVREALWLRERLRIHAMIDLSDGLAGDAAHLAAASGAALLLAPETLPVHPSARSRSRKRTLRLALSGGEDYELCFTAAAGAVQPFVADFESAFGVPLTCVGRVGGGNGVWFADAEGRRTPVDFGGWQHFGAEGR